MRAPMTRLAMESVAINALMPGEGTDPLAFAVFTVK